MALGEIADWMDEQYPPELREDWDRVGLICGDRQDLVIKMLLAVDPIEVVVDEILEWGAQLVIAHHPLFLHDTSLVSADTAKGRVVHHLIRSHTGLLNACTNVDAAIGGVTGALAEAAGLTAATWRPLEPNPNHPEPGTGWAGDLPEPCILGDLANRLAGILPNSPARLLIAEGSDREVETVAVSRGSGQSLLEAAHESNAEVFVATDLRRHPTLDCREGSGVPTSLVFSHWASRWLWLSRLAIALEL